MKFLNIFFSIILTSLPTLGMSDVLYHAAGLVKSLRQQGPSAATFDVTATVTYVSTNNFM